VREIQTQHSHIVVTKCFCEDERCITGKARCSRGLGFRVLQLEEICSNAGKKLKMHGRGRLTGSHVKVNEKVIRLQYATNWNKTILCKSKYKKQKKPNSFCNPILTHWLYTIVTFRGEEMSDGKGRIGKGGVTKAVLL
jgi:hypothetical protein